MIELSLAQFAALLGLSGAQLLTLIGIFNRLGALIVKTADHETRLTKLEGTAHAADPA